MEGDPAFVKEIDAAAARGDEASVGAARCLQAMRSVICANGCAVSSTAYFAATAAALQAQGAEDDEPRAAALLLILRRAIPATSPATVSARLSDLVAALAAVLKRNSGSELVAKRAIACLGMTADSAYNAGARPNRKVLKPVFSHLGDDRKSVRQQAELVATLILKRASVSSDQQTIDFMSEHLAQLISQAKHDKKAPDDIPARHAVAMLKASATSLPAGNLQAVCAAVLKLPAALGQHPCCVEGFECLSALLGERGVQGATVLAAGLLPGLLEVPVPLLNVAYVVAHSQALAAAASAVTGTPEGAACRAQVAAALRKLLGLFSERDPGVLKGAREGCLSVLAAAGERRDVELLQQLPDMCRPLLAYECKGAWTQSLKVVTGYLAALDAMRLQVPLAEVGVWTSRQFGLAQALLSELFLIRDKSRMAELRDVFGKELDECLCAAVTTFGPESVLSIAPLQLLEHTLETGTWGFEQQSRSWMLLVLAASVKRTSAAFFSSHFLPMASALKARADAAAASSPVHCKKYALLLEHVWGVLPAFFQEPLDLNAALLASGGQLAKQLVAVLLNEPNLRDHVWLAFKRICDTAKEPPTPLSEATKESDLTCLRTLSSRVLPEMFNTYLKVCSESEGRDLSVSSKSKHLALSTIQAYASIAEPQMIGGLFKNMVAKLLKATTGQGDGAAAPEQQAPPLSDLANALLPHLSAEFLELALKVFTPMMSGDQEDRALALALQKGGYRALRSILEHPATSKVHSPEKILGLWVALRDSRQTCIPAALKVRLTAIEALLSLMQANLAPRFNDPAVRKEFVQCLTTVLPEILFHLRDQGQAVRDAARACLHVAATTAVHQELQAEIVTLLSAGLAGLSRHSKASAVDALSRLLYEHSYSMSDDLLKRLVQVVMLLLGDSDAQVWRAALKFTKVVVFVLPKELMTGFLPQILVLFQSKHIPTAKMMVRRIVERLVRVFPPEELAEVFPKDHLPLLHYVQKQMQRRLRPKGALAASGGGDEEDGQGEEADADMGAAKPKQSWDDFDKGDEEMRGPESFGTDKLARRRKKGEAAAAAEADAAMETGEAPAPRRAEPPTSAVAAHEAVQALLDAWEEESDSDGEGGRKARRSAKGKRKRDGEEAATWIHEDADVPLDFMSANAAHSVLTTRPSEKKRQRGTEVGKLEALRRSGLEFSKDGRLVVAEVPDAPKEDEGEKFTHGADTKKLKPLSQLAEKRKARALAKLKAKYEHRGSHVVKGLDGFKPGKAKAQGDATRKSKLKPFAYVRLNPKVTKEKYKDKATQSFSKVVQGSKKGVVKGLKAKTRDAKVRKTAEVRKQAQKRSRQNRKPTHGR